MKQTTTLYFDYVIPKHKTLTGKEFQASEESSQIHSFFLVTQHRK